MSGVEFIVGAVLGSVPIAVETYDRSKRVFQIFSTYKHYPRELRAIDAKFGAQRAIFRNNAINLLDEITRDRSRVQEVMNRPTSKTGKPSLIMATVYHHRLEALHDSFTSCYQIAEQMQNTLQNLCNQLEQLVGTGGKQDTLTASEWLRAFKARCKLGLNKPQFGEAIEELRGLNRDFESIATQITKALLEILQHDQCQPTSTKRTVGSLNVLQRYHRIRHASRLLYSTLQVQWSCSSHNRHSFDMRIIERNSVKGKEPASTTQCVTYELAVTGDAAESALRLEVEQSCESDDDDPDHSKSQNPTIKMLEGILRENAENLRSDNRPCNGNFRRNFKKAKNQHQQMNYVDSGTSFGLPALRGSIATFQINESLDPALDFSPKPTADLSLVLDLCSVHHDSTISGDNRLLVGCLKAPRTEWFLPVKSQTTRATTSLSRLISWISEEPVLRSLPRPLLVHLAGNVAEGIMQLYSTPWLAYTNLGQNVRYLEHREKSSDKVQLEGPFFMTSLESSESTGQIQSDPSLEASCSSDNSTLNCKEARNKLLFNFGVLLLEIGYSKPWHELRESVSKTQTPRGESLSDYRVAERLAHLLINQMGLTYPKIVKKCLGCDFGLGETDMANEDLQRQFLDDVVLGLRRLTDHMKDTNFAPLG